MFESGGSSANTKFYNNICLGKQEICVGDDDYNAISSPMSKNGWTNHLVTGIGADDFVSLDEDDALMPRAIDGSLPRRFARLAADSKMVDAGDASHDIPESLLADFPFLRRTVSGLQRDMGPYERPSITDAVSTPIKEDSQLDLPRKYLHNGQLIIFNNGRRYNALGQEI